MAREIEGFEYSEEIGGPVWASLLPNAVEIKVAYDDEEQWRAILAWVEDDGVPGRFAFSENAQHGGWDYIEFWFTDPNAAFAFKMRWC